jgi:hypothetical protein
MSKEPEVEHEYHKGKQKLTVEIHRYSLKSKKTRDNILTKLLASLESKPDRLIVRVKNKISKAKKSGKALRGQEKVSRLVTE